jgi:hypothetical protein
MDCFASLAMTAENSGNSPLAATLAKSFVTLQKRPWGRLKIPASCAIRLFSNNNAKFY